MEAERIRITAQETLSDNWYLLKKLSFDVRRRDGSWQAQTREVYDRGNGAVILLYNQASRTVLLTRQFRIPAFVNGHGGFLIEAAAGLLDDASPELRIRAEVEEETGYRVGAVEKIYDAFMSPGSVTERLHFFIGAYEPGDRVGPGGGLADEGEDIEVLELGYEQALAMIASGDIVDGKTIMLLQYLQLHKMQHKLQHVVQPPSLMILVAGPYRSGSNDDPAALACNLAAMESCALPLYRAGHLPVIGEWLALPMVRLAGSARVGDAQYDALFHSHAERLLKRCDAILRIGGASAGADQMVAIGARAGLQIFHSLAEIPGVARDAG